MFYIKLFIFVIVATIGTYFMIDRLINSTDHLPDTFDISSTNYMEREEELDADDEPAEIAQVKSELQLEIENERKELAAAALERQKERDEDAENNALSTDTITVEEDEESDAEEGESDEDESDGGNGDGKSTRSDSDADMQSRGKTEDEDAINTELVLQVSGLKKDPTKKQPETVKALDLAYAPPADSNCNVPEDDVVRVGINYRNTSFAIKGHSLTSIDKLIQLYRNCGGGKLLVLQNAEGLEGAEESLIQLRQDEVKYYLLRRLVPKDDMIFPDNL